MGKSDQFSLVRDAKCRGSTNGSVDCDLSPFATPA